ncbi:MAG: hypothetical protein OER77_05530 [Myxococcales bacterium]|nr:hypothetical protein [Myxococcales bacterium]
MGNPRDSVLPVVRRGADQVFHRASHVGYGVLLWLIKSWRRVEVEHNVPYLPTLGTADPLLPDTIRLPRST